MVAGLSETVVRAAALKAKITVPVQSNCAVNRFISIANRLIRFGEASKPSQNSNSNGYAALKNRVFRFLRAAYPLLLEFCPYFAKKPQKTKNAIFESGI